MIDDFRDLISSFLTYLTTEKHYSKHTVEAYGRDLRCFNDFYHRQGYHPLNGVFCEKFTDYLVGKSHKPASIRRRLIAVKSFMRFLKREDIAPTNDVEHAELPKLPSKCPVVLSEK